MQSHHKNQHPVVLKFNFTGEVEGNPAATANVSNKFINFYHHTKFGKMYLDQQFGATGSRFTKEKLELEHITLKSVHCQYRDIVDLYENFPFYIVQS